MCLTGTQHHLFMSLHIAFGFSCVSKSSALQLLVTITRLGMKQLLFYSGAYVAFVHH